MNIKPLLFFLYFVIVDKLPALMDLDKLEQTFVLETKKINIPGYPDAFNPSIVQWNGRLLMSFRTRDPSTQLATLVGFTWLDKDFNPVGISQLLHIDKQNPPSSYIQDPRLIAIKDKLYIVYSDLWEEKDSKVKTRRMCTAEIDYDGVRFYARKREFFLDFEGDKNNKSEKNWVPFDYQGTLLFAYSISPHKIFFPIFGERDCNTIAFSQGFNPWKWGILRGGTPALLLDGSYLAFFHSSKVLTTVQSDGKSITHYFMGAYLFENHPPFAIKKISPKPIVSKEFYNGPAYQTWKPLRVIFPGGFIYDKKYIWIAYGRQDYESWIVKLDKKDLLNSLIPFQNLN